MSNLWWLAIALVILVLSMLLYSRLRRKAFERYWFGTGRKKKIAGWFEGKLGYTTIVGYGLIFAGAVALIYLVFGESELLSGLLLGAAILTFTVFQLPRLLKPNLYVVFLPGNAENKSYEDTPGQNLTIRSGQEKVLFFFRVTNVGFNEHRNCTFWFIFPEGFTVLTEQDLYEGLDFSKEFEFQKQNRCAKFLPNQYYLSIAPGNHQVFPIWVQITRSLNITKTEILVEGTSETSWGRFSKKLQLYMENDD